jgi:hypothetical protein
MGDLADFERGQIIGACLAEASVKKLIHYYVYQEREFLMFCQHTQIIGR